MTTERTVTKYLFGMLCGVMMLGCMLPPAVQPVMVVPSKCPNFQDLPYILDDTVPDDQLICVSVWRERPLAPFECMKAEKLKALIAGIKGM